eukprot:UN08447
MKVALCVCVCDHASFTSITKFQLSQYDHYQSQAMFA